MIVSARIDPSSSRYPIIISPTRPHLRTLRNQDLQFHPQELGNAHQSTHFRPQVQAKGTYRHPTLNDSSKKFQQNSLQQYPALQHMQQQRSPPQHIPWSPMVGTPRHITEGFEPQNIKKELDPYQSYVQYCQQQRQQQHHVQEYQEKNHPINLNNYIVKVIVSPQEILVLEQSGNINADAFKQDTATISSTSSTSVLIRQLSSRLLASAVTSATGECPPKVENIATYLRTVQYHLRNKAEPRFWPYFANASSSGSISCAYVEKSQDARPIVNSTNKARVNPAQFWHEARKACESVKWCSESIQLLLYLFVTEMGTQNGVPTEILLIVHDGEAITRSELNNVISESKSNVNRSTNHNRISQNLEKVLQEYLETEKKLTSTSILNGTAISKSESSPVISADDLLYDQSLTEFQAYMNIAPPVPEKDQGYLSSVINKARQLRRSISIKSSKLPIFKSGDETTSSEESQNHSLGYDFDPSNDTLPTKLTASDFNTENLFQDNDSTYSFTPGKGSFIHNTRTKARVQGHTSVEVKKEYHLPKIPPGKARKQHQKVSKLKYWFYQLFSIKRHKNHALIYQPEQSSQLLELSESKSEAQSEEYPQHRVPASNLSRRIKPQTPFLGAPGVNDMHQSPNLISDKYLLTKLDVVDRDVTSMSQESYGSEPRASYDSEAIDSSPFSTKLSESGHPPRVYNELLGNCDIGPDPIMKRSLSPSVPQRAPSRPGLRIDTAMAAIGGRPKSVNIIKPSSGANETVNPPNRRAYSAVYHAGSFQNELANLDGPNYVSLSKPLPKIQALSVIPLSLDSLNLDDW